MFNSYYLLLTYKDGTHSNLGFKKKDFPDKAQKLLSLLEIEKIKDLSIAGYNKRPLLQLISDGDIYQAFFMFLGDTYDWSQLDVENTSLGVKSLDTFKSLLRTHFYSLKKYVESSKVTVSFYDSTDFEKVIAQNIPCEVSLNESGFTFIIDSSVVEAKSDLKAADTLLFYCNNVYFTSKFIEDFSDIMVDNSQKWTINYKFEFTLTEE